MNELQLIRAIQRYTAAHKPHGSLQLGIGDDCAIVRPKAGEDLLFTADFVVEDIHFRRATHTGVDTGWKALARSLSDIAAMGGEARFALVSLALAPWVGELYVRDLYKGINLLASRYGVAVIGGDVTTNPKLTIDVMAIGAVPRGKALRRDTAKAGDILYVSGPLGRAASRNYIERPEPRLDLARKLRGRATACMDLSDGIAMDLHRLCIASGVAANLDGILPVASGATLDQALYGGEDYELLCALPETKKPLRGLLRIGSIVAGKPGQIVFGGVRLQPKGWDPLG